MRSIVHRGGARRSAVRADSARGLRTITSLPAAATALLVALTAPATTFPAGVPVLGAAPAAAQDPGTVAAPASVTTIESRVVDHRTGRPLAAVRISAGARVAHTHADGHFRLELPRGVRSVEVRRLGYEVLEIDPSEIPAVIHLVPAPLPLGALSVTSARPAALAEGTSLAVQSVGGSELRRGAATSVAEGLEGVPGVSLQRTGSWGARPVVRGLGSDRVAVLVDGARVNQACVFGMDQGLATVDPAGVERVEVVQGPGSALHGSGNVGGVINVVTRSAPPDRDRWGEVRLSASSSVPGGSAGATAGARHGRGWLGLSGDATAFGDYRSPLGTVDGTSLRQGSAALEGGFEPNADHRVGLQAQLYEGRDIGWPMHGEAQIPRETRRSFALDWAWQRTGVLDALSTRGYVQRLDHEMWTRMVMAHDDMGGHVGMGGDGHASSPHGAPAVVTTTEAGSHSTTSGLRVQARLLPGSSVHLDVGAEATHLAAEATRWTETTRGMGATEGTLALRSWPAVRILDSGLFGQGEWRLLEATALTAGIRLDRISRSAEGWDGADEWIASGNVGLRRSLAGPFSLRSTLGWGYRTPEATELFGLALRPDGYIYQGDPEVRTERGRNTEVSVVMETDGLSVTATAYRNELTDLIVPVAVHGEEISGRPVRRYANAERARLEGVSGALQWSGGPWGVRSSVGYVRGTDRSTGDALSRIPPFEGSAVLRRTLAPAGWWVEAELKGAARQARVADPLGEPETAGYGVVGLRSGFALGDATVVLGVENLTDRAYRGHLDPAGILRPGRNFHLGVRRSFR
jgi:outer membrane receptor protein involved in Fe transport